MSSVRDERAAAAVAIDPAALREKYREERDKRLRTDAQRRYRSAEGTLAQLADDPHAGEPAPRDPVREAFDVLVIGGGFGGMQAAVALKEQGIEDFRIVEVAADFGGTWYWNRYPGARCDVESYIYLPLLEATGFVPTERYATGSEIFAYCQQLAGHYGLYEHALLQTRVTSMRWDSDAHRWIVATSRGDELRPRFVITQSGLFQNPQLPAIEGIEQFAGRMFHTARWDYEHTGGSATEPLDRLGDQRVGIVGTGATALQTVPRVAESAQQLLVFQRTPTAVGVRDNAPTDVEWFRSQPPGWHEARMDAFNRHTSGEGGDCPVDDGWTRFFDHLGEAAQKALDRGASPEELEVAIELADFEWGELLRLRVDELVTDPAKAAKLKAWYRAMCKRPGFSDDYLPAFARDNVDVIDTSEAPIERITPRGVVAGGVEHELDCLIFATGFELGTAWAHRAGYDVEAGTERISEAWADGFRTFHGLFSNEFPNVFFMGFTQTAVTVNATYVLGVQGRHSAFVIRHCLDRGLRRVRATAAAQGRWQEVIREKSALRRDFQEACTPGYFNAEGRPEDRRSVAASGLYTPPTEFLQMLEDWRAAGDFEGLEFG